MSDASCPKCQLPKDEGAWHCDGCGFQFSQDIEGTRARLQDDAIHARRMIWITVVVDIGIVAGLVYLAMRGYYYISAPLALMVFGSIGHAFHRRSVTAEHLRTFNRRHAPLPTATARPAS